MSEPRAITGLPEPHVATHAVGIPAKPRWTVKPFFSSRPVRYFEVSNSCMPSSPKENTWSMISCTSLARASTFWIASVFSRSRRASCENAGMALAARRQAAATDVRIRFIVRDRKRVGRARRAPGVNPAAARMGA